MDFEKFQRKPWLAWPGGCLALILGFIAVDVLWQFILRGLGTDANSNNFVTTVALLVSIIVVVWAARKLFTWLFDKDPRDR